ncbi:hypothetical protein BAUCODRAFT_497660 [Baudoinia panamericana UAMH 10762]|uniref:Uncharacterized protein n=1 Tax=Baudoinia panamericana (strain UAMH 10762) TaxID=717646 RepID=M2N9X2_BAUPA|nr:uncharacterized protein BAUCODRAFT_497660 [Baudoinia panamericana UAMH 10762]EMC95640.1 hypothetical protein BAUCODRAFT_497660 [Baudoinia panamericana UAMH 10762]
MLAPTPTITAIVAGLAARQATPVTLTANLPLTTIYTANSTCLTRPYGILADGTISGQPSAFRDYSLAEAACYPTSMFSLQYSTNLFYSPGVCPSGWGKASQQVPVPATSASTTVTLAWCCPSSMAFSNDGTYAYCSTLEYTAAVSRLPSLSPTSWACSGLSRWRGEVWT